MVHGKVPHTTYGTARSVQSKPSQVPYCRVLFLNKTPIKCSEDCLLSFKPTRDFSANRIRLYHQNAVSKNATPTLWQPWERTRAKKLSHSRIQGRARRESTSWTLPSPSLLSLAEGTRREREGECCKLQGYIDRSNFCDQSPLKSKSNSRLFRILYTKKWMPYIMNDGYNLITGLVFPTVWPWQTLVATRRVHEVAKWVPFLGGIWIWQQVFTTKGQQKCSALWWLKTCCCPQGEVYLRMAACYFMAVAHAHKMALLPTLYSKEKCFVEQVTST